VKRAMVQRGSTTSLSEQKDLSIGKTHHKNPTKSFKSCSETVPVLLSERSTYMLNAIAQYEAKSRWETNMNVVSKSLQLSKGVLVAWRVTSPSQTGLFPEPFLVLMEYDDVLIVLFEGCLLFGVHCKTVVPDILNKVWRGDPGVVFRHSWAQNNSFVKSYHLQLTVTVNSLITTNFWSVWVTKQSNC